MKGKLARGEKRDSSTPEYEVKYKRSTGVQEEYREYRRSTESTGGVQGVQEEYREYRRSTEGVQGVPEEYRKYRRSTRGVRGEYQRNTHSWSRAFPPLKTSHLFFGYYLNDSISICLFFLLNNGRITIFNYKFLIVSN